MFDNVTYVLRDMLAVMLSLWWVLLFLQSWWGYRLDRPVFLRMHNTHPHSHILCHTNQFQQLTYNVLLLAGRVEQVWFHKPNRRGKDFLVGCCWCPNNSQLEKIVCIQKKPGGIINLLTCKVVKSNPTVVGICTSVTACHYSVQSPHPILGIGVLPH